jgi:2Fe-2S ferredoxin
MSKVEYILSSGEHRVVDAQEGASVMQTALNNLIPGITGECGGELSCATCHVFVAPEWFDRLGDRSPAEDDMMQVTAAEPTDYSRLSCQIRCTPATDGMVITVPDLQ